MAEQLVTSEVVKVALLTPEQEILLLVRSDSDEDRPGDWDFPGGGPEPGEDRVQAAIREVNEEAGICLEPTQLELILSETFTDRGHPVAKFCYQAQLPDKPPVRLSSEHQSYEWPLLRDAITKFQHPFWNKAMQHLVQVDAA